MKMTQYDQKPLSSSDFLIDYDPEGKKPYENRKEKWKEVKDIAKKNGVSYDNWIQRMTKLGHDYKKAAQTPNNAHVAVLVVNGVEMKRKDFLDTCGVPETTWRRWMKQMTFEEALEKARKRLNEKMKANQ